MFICPRIDFGGMSIMVTVNLVKQGVWKQTIQNWNLKGVGGEGGGKM